MDRLANSPASVVVIFYNEPYSVILRTVYSILNTANERLLKEIILVDDASTNVELLDKLGYYVKTRLPTKVKLIRMKSR
jgi:polypeptide N-acetylgalactosaminyltransferase